MEAAMKAVEEGTTVNGVPGSIMSQERPSRIGSKVMYSMGQAPVQARPSRLKGATPKRGGW